MVHHKYFYILSLLCVSKAVGDCVLSLKQDFSRPSPVFIKDGAYIEPDAATGGITLGRSDTLLVACPGSKRKIVLGNQNTSYDVMEAHCVVDSTFRVDRWIGPFRDIKCSTQAYFTSEEVSGGCGGGRKLYRVGYEVKSKFYELYEACFDPAATETVYVKHTVSPSSKHIDPKGPRPQFSEGGLFSSVSMADLYKTKNQEERIKTVLGSGSGGYLSKSEYLTRGHLAPRADFSLRAEQRASFHYINTAPQWRKANAGPWAALEDGLRRRVNALGHPVTVYTGALGVASLDGRPFYLSTDKNNNGIVPVPMYFYKLVYDNRTKEAVAFISINASSLNSTAPEDLAICSSACEEYSWLKWKGEGNACCNYQVLADMAQLPKLEVKGRLVL